MAGGKKHDRRTKTVGDIATPVSSTIAGSTSIDRAAHLMRAWDVTEILVTDRSRLVGVLTATEVVVRAIAADAPPSSIAARDVCDTAHPRLADDQPVHEALEHMRSLGVPRLPVVDRRGRLVGSAWITDLDAAVAAEPPDTTTAPTRPTRSSPVRFDRIVRARSQAATQPLGRATWSPLSPLILRND